MPWVQYEVWSVDELGHEEIIDTTNSLKEANQLADVTLNDVDNGIVECIIYKETEGELEEVAVVVRD
jgi:hypothetical protein